ncbi:hypothetical protein WCLP8_2080003 [uncultured Gammaproteobacteria bacterium]
MTHTITGGEVTAGSASVTIASASGWGSDGSKTLTARVTDVAGNVGAAGGSLAVTLNTVAPTVSISLSDTILKVGDTATVTFTFSSAPSGFDANDVAVQNGLLSAFSATSNPLVYTATFTPTNDLEDATNVVTVGTGWTDSTSNTSAGSTNSANYIVDTRPPTAPSAALAVAVASNGISAAEKAAGVAVTVDLAGTGAVAGDTVELLIGGVSFGTAVTHTLTGAEITAGSVSMSIGSGSGSGWSSDGSKTLTARVTDVAGNVGTAGGSLTVSLDTVAPTTTISTVAFSADTAANSTTNSDFITKTSAQTISGTLSGTLALSL